ncbi:MAG: hypothetical protein DBY25_03060 [Clostridiales bacterium]|nr:MAG: hypothetical protein DBY25_03060 [Clostridiales bacterium]
MYIADLHIHSSYSRATSKDCDPEHLDLWARRKGIGLVGTGDFTHPAWRQILKQRLIPAEEGLYTLREELRLDDPTVSSADRPRFVVTGEISSIYKKNGRVRKVHNLILLPGLEEAEQLALKLEAIGNIHSDGRPILGLDSRDLLEITLESCPDAIFVPAHIWTPHFSLFGAFSGFDTIEECYEDLTPYIRALETGLSSDPPMNWRVSALDRFILISNSDAHSPAKLGREANLIDAPLSYQGLAKALRGEGLAGTIEFFPEEGKYHYDGHRNCGLSLTPAETEKLGGRCPVCGKKITIGVQHRVEELADRAEGFCLPAAHPFESLVPLPEVIAGSTGLSPASTKVNAAYEAMLHKLGPEFRILREIPPEEIERTAGPCVAEGIRRLRAGRVERIPGYDGEYGKIRLLEQSEIETINGQTSLFGGLIPAQKKRSSKLEAALKKAPEIARLNEPAERNVTSASPFSELNPEQKAAIEAKERAVAVVAGPGTGKTRTLVAKIAALIEQGHKKAGEITAVTFTNQAANEMRERLEQQVGKRAARSMQIGTFHAICLNYLEQRRGRIVLADDTECLEYAADVLRETGVQLPARQLVQEVSKIKSGLPIAETALTPELFDHYCEALRQTGALDFDDLLLEALAEWEQAPDARKRGESHFSYLLVDEFQDINPLQYRLIRAWGAHSEGIFVIGDPDQSIYGFRGSDAHCFERLKADFPELRTIRLRQNYRSTPEILSCALPVIAKNQGAERTLEANRKPGRPVRLLTAGSDLSEGIYVAKEIGRIVGGLDMLEAQAFGTRSEERQAREFSDIAVLYRTHRQARVLEKCLRQEGIPYVVKGRDDFLSDETVRGTIGFFRSVENPADVVSLRACLKLIWHCPEDLVQGFSTVWQRADPQKIDEQFEQITADYQQIGLLQQWMALYHAFRLLLWKNRPRKLLERWAEKIALGENEAYRALLEAAVFHKEMPAFLQLLALGQESDIARSEKAYTSGMVTLMTLHGSKGLEFPVVFLCGVQKGRIPLESPHRPTDLEEERRLFYVGMTRAKDELVLMTSKEPSLFLADIPAQWIKSEDAMRKRQPSAGKQLSLFG